MESEAPVEANHEVAQIITKSHTSAKCYLCEHIPKFKLSVRAILIVVHQPHITCIEEHSSIKRSEEMRAILYVSL